MAAGVNNQRYDSVNKTTVLIELLKPLEARCCATRSPRPLSPPCRKCARRNTSRRPT
jgi:hypothetical protein